MTRLASVLALLAATATFARSLPGDKPLPLKPDPALAEKLTPPAEVGAYSIQPPAGYELTQPKGPAGVKPFAWVGAKRADGTAPQLMILLITPPPKEVKAPTLEEFQAKMLDGVKRRRENWTETKPDKVEVNGIPFLRTRWSGTNVGSQTKLHGVQYVALAGGEYVQISSQDAEPHHADALKLAETAAATFKPR